MTVSQATSSLPSPQENPLSKGAPQQLPFIPPSPLTRRILPTNTSAVQLSPPPSSFDTLFAAATAHSNPDRSPQRVHPETILSPKEPSEDSISGTVELSLPNRIFDDLVNDLSYVREKRQREFTQIEDSLPLYENRLEEIRVQKKCLEQAESNTLKWLKIFKQKRSNFLETISHKFFTAWPLSRDSILLQPLKQKSAEDSTVSPKVIEENKLLAKFYTQSANCSPQEDQISLYYKTQQVAMHDFLETSNRFVVRERGSSYFKIVFDNELLFIPKVGKTYLVKIDEGAYLPALIKKGKDVNIFFNGPFQMKCLLQWIELEKSCEFSFSSIKDFLPFGPDHPNAALLEKDKQGRYLLKEKSISS